MQTAHEASGHVGLGQGHDGRIHVDGNAVGARLVEGLAGSKSQLHSESRLGIMVISGWRRVYGVWSGWRRCVWWICGWRRVDGVWSSWRCCGCWGCCGGDEGDVGGGLVDVVLDAQGDGEVVVPLVAVLQARGA